MLSLVAITDKTVAEQNNQQLTLVGDGLKARFAYGYIWKEEGSSLDPPGLPTG